MEELVRNHRQTSHCLGCMLAAWDCSPSEGTCSPESGPCSVADLDLFLPEASVILMLRGNRCMTCTRFYRLEGVQRCQSFEFGE